MKFHLLAFAGAAAAAALLLSSCGSGTGEDLVASARPQSLDGVVITLDGVRFEFIRNRGSALATRPGDVETGSFLYNLSGVQIRQYPNRRGDNSDVIWPDEITGATYTYQMVNATSGILTLSGFAANDLEFTGSFNAANGSLMFLFVSDSAGNENRQVQVDLGFETLANGQFVRLTDQVDMRIPGTAAPQFDIVRIGATVRLAGFLGGGQVPFNYIPEADATRPSRIVPETLNNKTFAFTNGAGRTELNFSIQFVRDVTEIRTGTEPLEIGTGIMRIDNVPVINAIDYTWQRIPGTDSARLVIDRSGSTLDGPYLLEFTSIDTGAYTGVLDEDTTELEDVVGTFFIPDAPRPPAVF